MSETFLARLKKDAHIREKSLLVAVLFFNALYAVFLFVVSRITQSKWFFVMSVYYGLLSVARIFVFVQFDGKGKKSTKIKTMLACGVFLLLINLTVSTMMFLLIVGGHYVRHHEITVITLATYTFSALTLAIINGAKHIPKNDHIYSCAKMISLVSASVSLVTLTNTMLSTFGAENLELRGVVLPLLCGAVALFIIISAVMMIRKAILDLRTVKNEEERQ